MASTGTRRLPERVEQGDVIEIGGSRFPGTLSMRVLSEPSYEHVGMFHEEVMSRVHGDPWMFAAKAGGYGTLVYALGGDEKVYLSFGEAAASVGAVHSTALDGIEVQ